MTNQQHANHLLQAWQTLRALPPEERLDRLMAEFFLIPLDLDIRYQDQLQAVAMEMVNV